jgi:hypothetical protein
MQIKEASKILAEMYAKAAKKEKAVSIHLFGIKYADQIRDMSAKEIVVGAGLPESYKTEIRKGINLAKYVEVRD